MIAYTSRGNLALQRRGIILGESRALAKRADHIE
jgi:hypothetical protein